MVEASNQPKKKEGKNRREKICFSKVFREQKNEFFLFLVSVPNLFPGTESSPENKNVNKRVSVIFLFPGTQKQKLCS